MQPVFLLIDVFLYALLACVALYVVYVLKTPPLKDFCSEQHGLAVFFNRRLDGQHPRASSAPGP